jgi:hypothetical protein
MDSGKLWEKFSESGRVADYLAYRQALLTESAAETHPLEDERKYTREAPRQERRDDNGGT